MVALMEEARAIGVLAKAGWKPKRTIVFAAWDGEEQALLGSTEWVEDHAQAAHRKAVAYINSDMNGRGLLDVGGSHSLERFANEIAQVVTEPKKGGTVGDRLIASAILQGTPEQRTAMRDTRLFEIDALGSGSDYSPFLQHLGIASLNIGFGGEGAYGQYHSIYDSIAHFERFMDPDYAYGVALAKVGGRTVLRLADADLLPFEFTRAAGRIKSYVADVQKMADTLRTETTEHNRRIDDGVFTLAANPAEKVAAPKKREPVPAFDFAPLTNAVERLTVAARRYDAKAGRGRRGRRRRPPIAAANGVLLTAERALTRKEGLPRRPWFRHQIYAPGFYTGYGVKTLPAVREAIEERNFAGSDGADPQGRRHDRGLRRRDREGRRRARAVAVGRQGADRTSGQVAPQLLWTSQRSPATLLCGGQTNRRRRREARRAARHARSHGAADARQHGPAARLRHRPAHRAGQRRHPEAERGDGLPGAHAPAAPALDLGDLGRLGEQPQGQVLRDHRRRPPATGARGRNLGSAGERDRAPARRRAGVTCGRDFGRACRGWRSRWPAGASTTTPASRSTRTSTC